MTPEEMKARTKLFALAAIKIIERLPNTQSAGIMGKQLLRSATSVGANYRAACRAKSKADFISKLKYVEEEADESVYWLELLSESGAVESDIISKLHLEAKEIVAMTVSSINTIRSAQ